MKVIEKPSEQSGRDVGRRAAAEMKLTVLYSAFEDVARALDLGSECGHISGECGFIA